MLLGMAGMFYGCSQLKELDLSLFDTSKVLNMTTMFRGCTNLTKIYVGDNWITNQVSSSEEMFFGCLNLKGAISYDNTKTDIKMANCITGYLTLKSN